MGGHHYGGAALGGLPWVLCNRRMVLDGVEAGLRLLRESQRDCLARTYLG
jgi:hypothetical protein